MSAITNKTVQENKSKLYNLLFNGLITMKEYFNALQHLNHNSKEKV